MTRYRFTVWRAGRPGVKLRSTFEAGSRVAACNYLGTTLRRIADETGLTPRGYCYTLEYLAGGPDSWRIVVTSGERR